MTRIASRLVYTLIHASGVFPYVCQAQLVLVSIRTPQFARPTAPAGGVQFPFRRQTLLPFLRCGENASR
jgi:hypothetical protein